MCPVESTTFSVCPKQGMYAPLDHIQWKWERHDGCFTSYLPMERIPCLKMFDIMATNGEKIHLYVHLLLKSLLPHQTSPRPVSWALICQSRLASSWLVAAVLGLAWGPMLAPPSVGWLAAPLYRRCSSPRSPAHPPGCSAGSSGPRSRGSS